MSLRHYSDRWFGNHRYLCDVLDDMRKCVKTLNFSPLEGLIEEAQIMGNRMEAALSQQKDLLKLADAYSQARKEHNALVDEIEKLKSELKELKPEAASPN